MGEAQMLAEMRIHWGSDEHLFKIDEIMENISFECIQASSNLALEKGSYADFKGSNWSKGIFPIDVANERAKAQIARKGEKRWNAKWLFDGYRANLIYLHTRWHNANHRADLQTQVVGA